MTMLAIDAIFRRVVGMKNSHGLAAMQPDYSALEQELQTGISFCLSAGAMKGLTCEENFQKSRTAAGFRQLGEPASY
jgi:hypothetical protein